MLETNTATTPEITTVITAIDTSSSMRVKPARRMRAG
jgi:hypothetical protein